MRPVQRQHGLPGEAMSSLSLGGSSQKQERAHMRDAAERSLVVITGLDQMTFEDSLRITLENNLL